MSVGLLLPLGLSALLALVIPVLLHLHRRQQRKTTPFAALRWIRGPARPRRRLRLEQWPLLLLRLVLLVALALLLAEPVWRGERAASGDWVVVVPGVDAAQARAQLALPMAHWHWLLPDFPALSARTPAGDDAVGVASLLRELDSELPAGVALHVLAPPLLQGLDGGSVRLSRAVDWQIVNSAPAAPVPPPAPPPLGISLRQRDDAAAARYLQAAVAAGNRGGTERYRLTVDAPDAALDATTAVVFWLAGEPTPALLRWVEDGGTALLDTATPDQSTQGPAEVLARDSRNAPLLRAQSRGRGRLLSFAAPLQPQALPLLLDSTFATLLLSHLQPAAPPPDRAAAAAVAPLTGAVRADAAPRPFASWLLLVVALLALAERALSLHSARRRT
ncbi:BatA domain-containing protein [Tahibacter sp.]|uniref:BatA domain-containing protein n=1 Tax=Tahibacter sp. TaxID=2056211 RepID=UPI0028C41F54|nr:BatA domain-containing protein [Tahibacter sp.]